LSFRFRFLAVAIAVACGVLIGFPSWAGAQCVDEALKEQLIGKRAYRGVVPRLFKKALRHELSPMGGWYAGDVADGAPIYGGAYTFHFTEELGLEAAYFRTQRSFGFLEAIGERNGMLIDTVPESSGVNMFLGHLVWSMAYGKVRWFGGPIGRFDFYLSLGGGAVDEAGSQGVAGSGGFGMKLFLLEWLGLRLDARDQVRSARLPLGEERIVNDITLMGGFSVFIPFST
jgi:outer membrane beta-barrel protein